MPMQTEISPNEPDVMPDYVDFAPEPEAPEEPSLPSLPEMDSETIPPPFMDMESPAAPLGGVAGRVEAEAAPEAEAPVSEMIAENHRDGECVPNVPDSAPEVVSESTVAAPPRFPDPALTQGGKAVESRLARWHMLITVLAVSLLGALVFSQVISSLAMASTLPVWAQYTLLIPLGVCCMAVLTVCFNLLISWVRLRAVRQVDLAALDDLRRRAQTRRDGVEHFQAAREQVERYLKEYPLSPTGQARLREAGLKQESLDALVKNRDFLSDRSIDSRSWLEEFREHFQGGLDQAADTRVRTWALKAAGCVIASPLPLLDSILVLGISLKLIKDLCTFYNVRSSRSGSLVLLTRAVTAAFIAGVAENVTEAASEEISSLAADTTLGAMGARMAGIIGPKLGEGAVNAFFIHRLGRATIRMLQPLR